MPARGDLVVDATLVLARIQQLAAVVVLKGFQDQTAIQVYWKRNVRKRTFGHVRPARIQISFHIRAN